MRAIGVCVLLVAASAHALPSGQLAVLSEKVEPGPSFEKEVKKKTTTKLVRTGDGWKLRFVAYLTKAAGAAEVNLVFYPAGGLKPGESPDAYPIGTQPNAKVLLSEVDISPEVGIKPGKYQLRITRIVGGKEVVLAKGNVELADK